MKTFLIRRRALSLTACAAAVCLMFYVINYPAAVDASASQRQLPIYCVQREDKVCSLTFDAAWGNASLRHTPASCLSDWKQGCFIFLC